MRNVVARHDRESRRPCLPTPLQPGQDDAEHGRRLVDVGGVGDNRRMSGIEFPRRWVDEITALGDGQRDDADRRVCQPADDGGAVAGDQEIDHRAGHPRLHVAVVLLDHRGQKILAREFFAPRPLALENPRPDQRPIAVDAGVEQIVEIDRLVRAMEIADAEMQDSGGEVAAAVFWRGDAWGEMGQGGEGEFRGHFTRLFFGCAGVRSTFSPCGRRWIGA
jgi:hypothetical protein